MVGAGITGLSLAWFLRERAVGRVTVVEREGVGAGASGVQPGGVRQQWSTRVNCLLARESAGFYRDLGERLGAADGDAPVLEPCGYLFVAHTAAQLERYRAAVALQRELGVPSRLLEPGELADVVEGVHADGLAGGAYCAEDGYFDRPQAVVELFGAAARRAGAAIAIAEVTRLDRDGRGWRARLAGGENLTADHVVVATGYDAPTLLEPAGVDVPVSKQPRHLFFSEPVGERLLEPLVVAPERAFAAKQLRNGRVLASDLHADGCPGGRDEWRRRIRAGIEELVPRLAYVSLPLLVTGFYDVTPDHQAIVGPADGLDGLWLAVGFSGHGFMMAPAIGRRLAGAIAGDPTDPLLAALSPCRFDRGTSAPELQVV